jgi:hypothetical protein
MVFRFLAWILAWPVEAYIRVHRRRLFACGVPVAVNDQAWLRLYFPQDLLEGVRIVERDPLPIADPPLARVAKRLGFRFPDVGLIAAITFDRVIATRQPMDRSTLFHELVHVAQYRALGVRLFAREYVRGLLETGTYESIPLEAVAYRLEERFRWSGESFQVQEEIERA